MAWTKIADISIRVVSQFALARDWIDYVALVAAVFAALGTVGAVVVALFGPRWQARRRRPALYVRSLPPSMSQSRPRGPLGNDSPATEFTVELGNRAGRDTGRDVEIFLSYARAVSPHGLAIAGDVARPSAPHAIPSPKSARSIRDHLSRGNESPAAPRRSARRRSSRQ